MKNNLTEYYKKIKNLKKTDMNRKVEHLEKIEKYIFRNKNDYHYFVILKNGFEYNAIKYYFFGNMEEFNKAKEEIYYICNNIDANLYVSITPVKIGRYVEEIKTLTDMIIKSNNKQSIFSVNSIAFNKISHIYGKYYVVRINADKDISFDEFAAEMNKNGVSYVDFLYTFDSKYYFIIEASKDKIKELSDKYKEYDFKATKGGVVPFYF